MLILSGMSGRGSFFSPWALPLTFLPLSHHSLDLSYEGQRKRNGDELRIGLKSFLGLNGIEAQAFSSS
jgi:hypothetical protein